MKLYAFNHNIESLETDLAVAIVAKSLEDALAIYLKETRGNERYTVIEHDIVEGLQVWPEGYADEEIIIKHTKTEL